MYETVDPKVFLKIETGTHSATIQHLIATPDGQKLVSVSNDKTIRVWDVKTGEEVRKILGQIGPGRLGDIHRLRMTPDGKHLIAVVRWNREGNVKPANQAILRVYDLATGNLQVERLYQGWLQDMHLSPDGKYLVACD